MRSYLKGSTVRLSAPDGATVLRVAGKGKAPITLTVDGGYAVLPAERTAAMPDAQYVTEWESTNDHGDVVLFPGPRFQLLPSIADGGLREAPRLWAERALEAVEAALLTAAASGEISLGVDGGSFGYESRQDLLMFRQLLRSEVEHRRAGNPVGARMSGQPRGLLWRTG